MKQGLIINPDKTYLQYFYKKTVEIKININNIKLKKRRNIDYLA